MNQHYDYIIMGGGCAGLSLLVRILGEKELAQKKILLVDRQVKNLNDRTWCFWEKEPGYFESILHHQWNKLWVKHPRGDLDLRLSGYSYKLIRGIDFYKYCFKKINASKQVTLVYGEVTDIDAATGQVTVDGQQYQGTHLFSSILLEVPQLKPKDLYLLQHFKGWWLETESDVFDPQQADLMNFRTSQKHGCAFVYLLPVSPRRALVEYTLFTEKALEGEEYDEGLRDFIKNELQLNDYRITETEQGIIPMTTYKFAESKDRVVFIGTAGGQTKASTGYTFQFIQRQANAIVDKLKSGEPLANMAQTPGRFQFYDNVLLRVLYEKQYPGADVFFDIFRKNKADNVLSFLDNRSSFLQELGIMNATPQHKFIAAAIRQYFS